MDWLSAYRAGLPGYVFLAMFALVALWELRAPLQEYRFPPGSRWLNNLTLFLIGSLLSRLCLPLTAMSAAILCAQSGTGLLNAVGLGPWIAIPLAIVLLDAWDYLSHRLFHAVPALWQLHKVHHLDPDCDVATAILHHPLEDLVTNLFAILAIVLLGAPPVAVLVAALARTVIVQFNHGNCRVNPTVDRLLGGLVVMPSMHRIHHSLIEAESRRNFGALFPWWDHVFHTHLAKSPADARRMAFGLSEAQSPHQLTFWRLLSLPFRRA